jgi:hypothetical protein
VNVERREAAPGFEELPHQDCVSVASQYLASLMKWWRGTSFSLSTSSMQRGGEFSGGVMWKGPWWFAVRSTEVTRDVANGECCWERALVSRFQTPNKHTNKQTYSPT